MPHPTETAKQISDLIRGDQIAAMQVREFLTPAELIDLLALHDYVNEQMSDLTEENDRLRRILRGN